MKLARCQVEWRMETSTTDFSAIRSWRTLEATFIQKTNLNGMLLRIILNKTISKILIRLSKKKNLHFIYLLANNNSFPTVTTGDLQATEHITRLV